MSLTTNTHASLFHVTGHFPGGDEVGETISATSGLDAAIRVKAACRYSEAGGELSVSFVRCAGTHEVVLDLSQIPDLEDDSDAVFDVVYGIRDRLPLLEIDAQGDAAKMVHVEALRTYVSFFDLVISVAPEALIGCCGDHPGYSEDDLTVSYDDEDLPGREFVPADALRSLAEESLKSGWSVAAVQCIQLANFARSDLSLSCMDSVGIFA